MHYRDMYKQLGDNLPDNCERICTAVADAREILFMHQIPEQLKNILGPNNFRQLLEYLEVINETADRIRKSHKP